MKKRMGLLALVGVVAGLGASGTANAAFPDFSGCPRAQVTSCLNIQQTTGSINIKGFNVPLGPVLEVRGGLDFNTSDPAPFIPATGTNGFIGRAVAVPGGLLGIDLPIAFNDVYAQAELAGPSSSIRFDQNQGSLSLPIKLRLINPLIGPNCHVGSNSNPARVNLTLGPTNPPPPNRPISGSNGRFDFSRLPVVQILGQTNVDNAFAVPGATGCGFLGLGLIDLLVNAKLRTPSAAGNNTIISTVNVGLVEARYLP